MKVYSYSMQGKRDDNEDQHYHYMNLDGKNKGRKLNFFGVFDGHGGKLVSSYLKKHLPKSMMNTSVKGVYSDKKITKNYVTKIFKQTQNKLKEEHPKAVEWSGSTAVCCVMKKVDNKTYLWVSHVGDSRAVICNNGKAIGLTTDHKPNLPSEKRRIEKLGGKITYDGFDWRIKDLSMARAFGDTEISPFVSQKPDVKKYKLKSSDKYLIVACDGLWDSFTNKAAVHYVNRLIKNKFKGNYAKELAKQAYKLGSTDNITVMVIML